MIGLQDVLRALTPGEAQGDACRGTDPLQRLTGGTREATEQATPEALTAAAGYVQRTVGRRAAMAELDELCFWHLLPTEIEDKTIRALTLARRELHIRLKNSQIADDLAYAKLINH